ncbi:MAG: hypothetical protein IT376_18725 [Polyangiaceae bacterium]|nr:hypothetical protein [Polyangiaceae bacterium]
MSDGQKETLTLQALGLLNEQVQARIVHYKGEMETNAELDAITAQVVAQLKAMQATIVETAPPRRDPGETEAEQARTMTALLQRILTPDSNFATSILKSLGKRIAKLFFESELHERTKADKEKTIHHAEQGVFYVLSRYKNRLRAELEGFEYVDPEIKQLTLELLAKMERDLQVAFLSRRSPELNRVMTIYTAVLMRFLHEHLPPHLGALARDTLRAAGTAAQPNSVGYKVLGDRFPAFRAEWERAFMQRMVSFCGDELLAALTEGQEAFREETVKFFTDPHVFSASAQVICDSLYDFLCLEGFLDLPVDWRVSLARES